LLGGLLQQGLAQYYTPIGTDTLNRYAAIDSLYNPTEDVATVVVDNPSLFGVGDTVMVYFTKGAKIETEPQTNENDEGIVDPDDFPILNAGKYAFLLINAINGNRITLNNHMPNIQPLLQEGEQAQLIRVHSFRRARVEGEITVPPWDPVTGTGGVFALFVQRKLILDEDINLDNAGFRGASESTLMNVECSTTDPDAYDSLFYHTNGQDIIAGLKGGGITLSTFEYMRGKSRSINGGGGGNGRLSGGGGGSNYGEGGKGGYEFTEDCASSLDTRGYGGINMDRFGYVNEYPLPPVSKRPWMNRAYMGGGGGRGTNISGQLSSDGGDGGGLVVIIADSIVGNGNVIHADGESVSPASIGAGGGGGGGGAILLDVNGFESLSVRAIGGDGGDTNYPTDTTGPGGGGGGGAYWIAGSAEPDGLTMDRNNSGEAGEYLQGANTRHGAGPGDVAHHVAGLEVPLRGFIFNTVPEEYTVCSDVIPGPIFANLPWGGDGTYTYEWLDSTASHTWQTASNGINGQPDFVFTDSLSETTWYRRVVESGELDPDTSFRIAVYVQPSIKGNHITASDTVCFNNAPLLPFVPGNTLTGGTGSYTYQWYSREEGNGYGEISGATDSTFLAGALTETTYFIREVKSGACISQSDSVLVKVWETLSGNQITDNDTVCYNTPPELIGGNPPTGGDPADIRYLWDQSTDTVAGWTQIPSEENQSLQSGPLTETTYFRRRVLSGSGDACKDTSNTLEVLNIPLITGNTIAGDQTVCTNQFAGELTGSAPGGGYQGLYSYQWESRTLSSAWEPASGINDLQTDYDPGEMTGDTTWFRRVVGSGRVARNECLDYSDSIAVNVLPLITNNLITVPDTVQCQLDTVGIITQDPAAGTEPGGGATQGGSDPTRRYQWETASGFGAPGTWTVIAGADQLNYDGQPVLGDEEDRFFRRIVYSGPEEQCADTATLTITVHTQITGNTIEPFDSVCFADMKLLLGSTPSGEPGLTAVYTWRDLDNGTDLPGSDQEDFTTGPFDQLGQYHYLRRVAIGECLQPSNDMQITVMQLPGGQLTDDPFIACEKDTVLAIDLTMDELQTFVTPWQVYLRNQDSSGIGPITVTGDGPLTVTLDIGALDSRLLNYELDSIIYRSVEDRYKCVAPAANLSGQVPITVFRQPDPQILVDDAALPAYAVCDSEMTLAVDTDNGTGSWSSEPPGIVSFTQGATADEFIASIPGQHEEYGTYQLIFTSQAGDCSGSFVLDATFDEQPDPPVAGDAAMVYLRDTYTMQAEPASAGTGNWELLSGGGIIEDPNDPHTDVYGLSEDEDNVFRWTVSNGVCIDSSDIVIVYWNEVKRYQGFSPGNDDMSNEYFIMEGLAYADEFEISFFNSLGNTVRTVTHETMDELEVDESLISGGLKEGELVVWDGLSNNGNPVPSGTYYFVINLVKYPRDWQTGNIIDGEPDIFEYKDYVVVMRD
jgi:hypothetical protein